MDILLDETGARIAHRLRLERDARAWSLADLASRSGVSKATISKIERGEVSPTAVILVRLAGAFDLTLAGLLLRAEGDGQQERVARAAHQPVWRDPATGYTRRQVLCRPDHPLELVQVELPAGRQVVLPAIWVLAGELVILEGSERHALAMGDCLPFGPPSEVTLSNEGALPCSYLVVLARS